MVSRYKVNVIIDKHGYAPSMLAGMPNGREWQSSKVIAIIFHFWCHDVRFVPDRGRGISHVRIIAKKHFPEAVRSPLITQALDPNH